MIVTADHGEGLGDHEAPYHSSDLYDSQIHVPLVTNDGVVFFCGGSERHFPVGEAVEVSNLGPHWVRNDGDTDRIHLIFEYYDAEQPEPDWLAPMLEADALRQRG